MRFGFLLLASVSLSMVQTVSAADSPAKAEHLCCEYRVDPLGIGVTEPRLCWQINDARRGAKQTAYQVLVADSLEKLNADVGDLWDSGRVATDQTTQVVYAGKPLLSRIAAAGRSVSGTPRGIRRTTANRPYGRWGC